MRLSISLISLTQLGQILLLPVQTLFFFKGDPMSYLGSCGWTLGRSLDRGLSGRIHLFEGPRLSKCLRNCPKNRTMIAISTRIALFFYFTIRLLSISASLVPPANQVVFVWLKHGLARRMNMSPFWGLLHTQILIDALPTQPLPAVQWWRHQLFWQRAHGSAGSV